MMEIRRINLLSGPCGGKSLTATNVRSALGLKGYNIELVDEYIKDWTYVSRKPMHCDSYYLQACQIQKEDIRLRSGVDYIITDSPIMLQYFYATYHIDPLRDAMLKAAQEFESIYPSIYIFIEREDKFYTKTGRYEELLEAKKIDNLIKETMTKNKVFFKSFSCLEQNKIIEDIISKIGDNGR
jgi:hypothetical protein